MKLTLALFALTASLALAQEPGFTDLSARALAPKPGAPKGTRQVDLEYSLRTKLRTFLVKADFWAGGKLRMDVARDAAGRTTLSLSRILEAPWKFMWFDPRGLAAQAGYAADVTLAAGSWDARKAAEAETLARAKEMHAKWQRESQGTQTLNWNYSFYVIGDPAGRFSLSVLPGGRVDGVVNRMTGRYLPKGFSNWLAGKPEEGYGYWAEDAQPPEYTPRCYEAFVAALSLLEHPLFPGRAAEPGTQVSLAYPGVLEAGRNVIETLAPKAKGRFDGSCDFPMSGAVASGPAGTVTVELASPTMKPKNGQGIEGRFSRAATLDRATLECVSDHARLDLSKGSESHLELDVRYGPAAP